MVEITAFRLERIFQPKRVLKFITGNMFYNPALANVLIFQVCNTFSTKFTGFRFELPSWKTYHVQPEN